MLQTIQLPAGIPDLGTSLADMNRNAENIISMKDCDEIIPSHYHSLILDK